MKLLIVILNDKDADEVLQTLIDSDFRATRIASTGGFLRRGNTTLLIGTETEHVDRALDLIKTRSQEPETTQPQRAIVFVLDVDQYKQL